MFPKQLSFSLLVSYFLALWLYGCKASALHAQSLNQMVKQSINRSRITVSQGDSTHVFFISNQQLRKASEKLFYFWYSAGTIKSTQGGYAGKLIDGQYRLYDHGKLLREQGQLQLGLKVGKWYNWYPNGFLRETYFFRSGLREGRYISYYPNGTYRERGRYKHDKKHGKWYIYPAIPDSLTAIGEYTPIQRKYRKGVGVPLKRRHKLTGLADSLPSTTQPPVSARQPVTSENVRTSDTKKGTLREKKRKPTKLAKRNRKEKQIQDQSINKQDTPRHTKQKRRRAASEEPTPKDKRKRNNQ